MPGMNEEDSYDSSDYDDDDGFLGWDHSRRETQRERRLEGSQRSHDDEDPDDLPDDDPSQKSGDDSSLDEDGVFFPNRGAKFSNSNRVIQGSGEAGIHSGAVGGDGPVTPPVFTPPTGGAASPVPSSSSSVSSSSSLQSHPSVSTLTVSSPFAYSIRIRLLLAVDLPVTLTPTTPLTPQFKVGLLQNPPPAVKLQKYGLVSLPSHTRCSSGKILSPKDAGKAEWHEEMRWDGVKSPLDLSLVLELCLRSVSPPQVKLPGYGPSPNNNTNSTLSSSDMSQITTNSATSSQYHPQEDDSHASSNRKTSLLNLVPHFGAEGGDDSNAVLPNVKALWRRGKAAVEKKKVVPPQHALQQNQQLSTRSSHTPNEMEAASAAAAVARFLVNDDVPSSEMSGGGHDAAAGQPQAFSSRSLTGPTEVDKKQRVTDVRVGHLTIPLNELPLDEISNVAFIESWYPIEIFADVRGGTAASRAAANKAFGKRKTNPSVLMEISFSSSQYLDECEDEMDDEVDGNIMEGEEGVMWDPNRANTEAEGSDSENNEDDEEKFIEATFGSVGGSFKIDEDKATTADEERTKNAVGTNSRSSISMRSSLRMSMRGSFATQQSLEKEKEQKEKLQKQLQEEPVVEPGVLDFICMVGARDIGSQVNDDGAKGWVQTAPECAILEQFPPSDEFHRKCDRLDAILPNKVEWFCFPEGMKLWRGTEPPTARDLNLPPRDNTSSHHHNSHHSPNLASSIATFDACLNSTTSFSWFVMSSTSEEYGSKNVKTYGVVIRFYSPAPAGVDSTQDDFAQVGDSATESKRPNSGSNNTNSNRYISDTMGSSSSHGKSKKKQLWVPLGICVISSQPIVGVMEVVLLRICETVTNKPPSTPLDTWLSQCIHSDLANLIINFQAPVPGVLHCSIPFLSGERLHLTLPPPTGLPALPHGGCVASVCRLLGAEGFTTLLAAVLTECKILLHSNDISNLAMVAEVMTSLIYPFSWALPYIPVLPEAMLEIVEAPLSYMLGVPSCTMKWIDKAVLQDVVVIDLDNGFCAPDYFDGSRSGTRNFKLPLQLPATVSSNISKSVFRLLREEDEVEDQYFIHTPFSSNNHLPRLEQESLAEREFRISVAIQICGLVRGYQDCLFFVSASQPVFNRDRFLRNAPSLFEERRDNLGSMAAPQRILSPRSKRFLSLLINTQHFHQLLERLDHDDVSFFHEVMETFESPEDEAVPRSRFNASQAGQHLSQHLQKIEDAIPTYKVTRKEKKKRTSSLNLDWDDEEEDYENAYDASFGEFGGDLDLVQEDDYRIDDKYVPGGSHYYFTHDLLHPPVIFKNPPPLPEATEEVEGMGNDDQSDSEAGVRSLNMQYLAELEKNPWSYTKVFDIVKSSTDAATPNATPDDVLKSLIRQKVTLRDAIGERRFRAWQMVQKERQLPQDESSASIKSSDEDTSNIDLQTLLTRGIDETAATSVASSISSAGSSTNDRDVLKRCLEKAYVEKGKTPVFTENGVDLIQEAEKALRQKSAQQLLLSVLSQRTRLENERKRRQMNKDQEKGYKGQQGPGATRLALSRLPPASFNCLVRLCNAMLDNCMISKDYESAYHLLTHTAGFCTNVAKSHEESTSNNDQNTRLVYMTMKIGLHPIFADLRLWERVMKLHLKDQQQEQKDKFPDRGSIGSSSNGRSTPDSISGEKSEPGNGSYEAAKTTLYEMLGYGVPAEELARFATKVSGTQGWFQTEKGQALLVLARRLSVRRDEGEITDPSVMDLDVIGNITNIPLNVIPDSGDDSDGYFGRRGTGDDDLMEQVWDEVAWCHPTAVAFSHSLKGEDTLSSASSKSRPPSGMPNRGVRGGYVPLLGMLGASHPHQNHPPSTTTSTVEPPAAMPVPALADNGSDALYPRGFQGRSPITSLSHFGSSCVATGALDGSVFLAHTIHFKSADYRDEVRGVRLEWASSAPADGGRGAVSCLASAHPAAHQKGGKGLSGLGDETTFMDTMEGCRIVAGTTGGALNVWNVKDVYFANVVAGRASEAELINYMDDLGLVDPAMGSTSSTNKKLQYTLKGRALSGHSGGVTCIEVPSTVYRPDTLLSGGADGLIKLWSLRSNKLGSVAGSTSTTAGAKLGGDAPGLSMAGSGETSGSQRKLFGSSPSQRHIRMQQTSDAQATLAGHGGRILCVRTAWHGDRLLSGGADRTVRLWDLAVSGGKCLQTLTGHYGWVTQAHYWGPHTIVSASTDRSVLIWDARLGASPLFVLRYHKCHVSDLLLGSRTEPLMVSAGGDGTVATWDFRTLSSSTQSTQPSKPKTVTKTMRQPVASMNHFNGKKHSATGAVLLSKGIVGGSMSPERSVLTASVDGIIKEWEIGSGRMLGDVTTGHLDVISRLQTFRDCDELSGASGRDDPHLDGKMVGGTITSSWDGTVRMRRLRLVQQHIGAMSAGSDGRSSSNQSFGGFDGGFDEDGWR